MKTSTTARRIETIKMKVFQFEGPERDVDVIVALDVLGTNSGNRLDQNLRVPPRFQVREGLRRKGGNQR